MITIRNMEVMHVELDSAAEFMIEVRATTDEQGFEVLRLTKDAYTQLGLLFFEGVFAKIKAMGVPEEALGQLTEFRDNVVRMLSGEAPEDEEGDDDV